ncbi:invasion associated locus B family protein [Roseovarius indicus]|jgi:invasion protein IalB|uniref:Invasion protein n=1 Tax=Roseovarius indicus TaxID=540747 RepID=A0A0T5PA46_9RHOB|nr:invasion associated locus B family protein [Roseovarius indicus]KRS18169.1 invasion protein [Roseovarius indicus]QEW27005.1 Invasion protein B, involved in pathogenesis [Roseovarius indicus]SFD56031.1 Invasion protein IalB, involved in pathogenesis [Roseovarius indicus]
MSRFLFTLPLIALLAAGTAAVAQDDTATETETETTTEAPAEEGTSNANQLDMGQEVQEDPSYVKETYGDWQLQCFRSEAEEDPCQMYQLLREDAGNPVAEFSLFKLPDDSQAVAGATIVVPLGTLLPQGLKIAVDDGKAKAYNYSFCSMVGCFARIGFTQADVDALKAGGEAVLMIVPAQAPDQQVVIKASLDGFTKAYENVSIAPN